MRAIRQRENHKVFIHQANRATIENSDPTQCAGDRQVDRSIAQPWPSYRVRARSAPRRKPGAAPMEDPRRPLPRIPLRKELPPPANRNRQGDDEIEQHPRIRLENPRRPEWMLRFRRDLLQIEA